MNDGGGEREQRAAAGVPLFRPEVLRNQQSEWMGTILIKPHAMNWWFAAIAVLTVFAILLLLFTASYTRKARVSGWLIPQQGMVRVFAPRAAVVTALLVREGAQVKQGQPLAQLSAEETSAALGDTQAGTVRALEAQRATLDVERLRAQEMFAQQRAALATRFDTLGREADSLRQEIEVQQQRLALARQWQKRLGGLQGSGYISEQQVRVAAESALDQAAKLRTLQRGVLSLERERAVVKGELEQLPSKMATQEALIARTLAVNSRDLGEVEARRSQVIPAPQAGTVTAIHASTGTAVGPSAPLLSIVPRGVVLEAHLYAPSRAVGFVHAGQTVLLRYRAYPYQKFGHARGVIASVSRSAIEPSELPAMFAGSPAGSSAEAMYRVTVALDSQNMMAYGKAAPLQPGMQLDADVLLERRRLFEWVLDPVFTLTGRWAP
ncbi:HlyD family efflux transporter periplasmic adaptor subunit [Massilia niastensis]|uniref:HlyD family efflux transporter periplasmic adaptor subunit n=1 Tax=Massilia niastensis TaxID=544911 RepID=UPI00036F6AF0|nr:HlyD family efflux transporter periplasmic adaptor subunit [Massilia niastensis]